MYMHCPTWTTNSCLVCFLCAFRSPTCQSFCSEFYILYKFNTYILVWIPKHKKSHKDQSATTETKKNSFKLNHKALSFVSTATGRWNSFYYTLTPRSTYIQLCLRMVWIYTTSFLLRLTVFSLERGRGHRQRHPDNKRKAGHGSSELLKYDC